MKEELCKLFRGKVICIMSIAAITFLIACCVFPVGIIINTLISNPMVTLKGVPCIARETMTIGTYIIKSLGMSCILSVIYSLGNFAIGVRAKNGYYAFGILIVLSGIMKVLSAAAPTSTCMFFWTQYNPLDLVLKAGTWFLYEADLWRIYSYKYSLYGGSRSLSGYDYILSFKLRSQLYFGNCVSDTGDYF